jgi:hypothetical protein
MVLLLLPNAAITSHIWNRLQTASIPLVLPLVLLVPVIAFFFLPRYELNPLYAVILWEFIRRLTGSGPIPAHFLSSVFANRARRQLAAQRTSVRDLRTVSELSVLNIDFDTVLLKEDINYSTVITFSEDIVNLFEMKRESFFCGNRPVDVRKHFALTALKQNVAELEDLSFPHCYLDDDSGTVKPFSQRQIEAFRYQQNAFGSDFTLSVLNSDLPGHGTVLVAIVGFRNALHNDSFSLLEDLRANDIEILLYSRHPPAFIAGFAERLMIDKSKIAANSEVGTERPSVVCNATNENLVDIFRSQRERHPKVGCFSNSATAVDLFRVCDCGFCGAASSGDLQMVACGVVEGEAILSASEAVHICRSAKSDLSAWRGFLREFTVSLVGLCLLGSVRWLPLVILAGEGIGLIVFIRVLWQVHSKSAVKRSISFVSVLVVLSVFLDYDSSGYMFRIPNGKVSEERAATAALAAFFICQLGCLPGARPGRSFLMGILWHLLRFGLVVCAVEAACRTEMLKGVLHISRISPQVWALVFGLSAAICLLDSAVGKLRAAFEGRSPPSP